MICGHRVHRGKWLMMIKELTYYESVSTDKATPAAGAPGAGSVLPVRFYCPECTATGERTCFGSSRALYSHRRMKHQVKCPTALVVDADARCLLCQVCFSTRLRAIAHLSDARQRGSKPTCGSRCLELAPEPRLALELPSLFHLMPMP